MMTERERRMSSDTGKVAIVFLVVSLGLMVFGLVVHVWGQSMPISSQDGINAVLVTRQQELSARLDKIENLLSYGMAGVFGNLIAHLFQILGKRQRKQDEA